MKRFSNVLILSIALALSAGCATTKDPVAHASSALPDMGESINGKWEGRLSFNGTPVTAAWFRLTLEDSDIKVFEKNTISSVWSEAMPGSFRISRQGSNAIVQATRSGTDEDGRWVETWVFVVTGQSENALRVESVRMVNNIDLPTSNPGKTFSYGGSGIFARAKPL